ncbi:unnamed protein product [Cylicocyclus nassatus]|uniref:Glycosyltransferase family 92 protein n=1 Tax=Cylicocyclus nassatus TaxID=53992 RepID=A0AA36H308_CYLNA|nr:unnamed protein product [Cylicocyclus nassatus]
MICISIRKSTAPNTFLSGFWLKAGKQSAEKNLYGSCLLLESYVKSGDVDVKYLNNDETLFGKWLRDAHVNNMNDRIIRGKWQMAAIEDCLYRNKLLSHYVLFGDLDERVIPTEKMTLSEFVQ